MANGLRLFLNFTIQLIFNVYILLLFVRLLLQFFHANIHNPIVQFIIKTTNFTTRPLQRFLPVYKSFNTTIAVALFIFQYIQLSLLVWIQYNKFPAFFGTAIWTCATLIYQLLNIWFYALFIRVILTWSGAGLENIYYQLTFVLTEPLLKPIRRFVPHLGILDITPVVLAILLQLIMVLVVAPFSKQGQILALHGIL